jgi:quercetin dioxygenase-like cupin family protein
MVRNAWAARALLTAVVLTWVGAASLGHDKDDSMKASIFRPDGLKWQEGPSSLPPGAKMAVLEGDPTKEGPFVFRVKVPDGYRIPPHTHPKPERVTILSGTFNIGMGEKFDSSKGQEMPAGTYGTWPAGMKHFVWVKGETVVQFHGEGPWKINYVNPDDDPRDKKE